MVQQFQQIKERKKPGRKPGSPPTAGSWKKGVSGNPGAIGPAGIVARELMSATAEVREELAAKIIRQALDGCLQSQRLLVERFIPQVRAQTLAQPLPGIDEGSIEERLQKVLKAASEGRVSADEAAILISAIKGATEAAAIAAAERDLQEIRQMRVQIIEGAQTRQNALQEPQMVQEESDDV